MPLAFMALLLLVALAPALGSAQTLTVKRLPAAVTQIQTCPAFDAPESGVAVTPAVIDSLINSGSEAALAGDHATARLLLRQASFLDPANPLISYGLAGSLEALGQADEARVEYCRYLALDPGAPDSLQVWERIESLTSQGDSHDEQWRSAVDEGITAHEDGRFADAISAFTRAINARPDSSNSYFNRAVSLVAAGSPAEAAADFQRYLELAPDAEDSAAVWAHLDELRAAVAVVEPIPADVVAPAVVARIPPAPGGVLVRGLLVPGLGQYATRRYITGTLVLAGAAGALYYGNQEELVDRTRQATDPFGNPYEYQVTVRERPNLALGFGGAVAIAAAGALESYFFARRERRAFDRAETIRRLSLSSSGDGGVSVSFSIPTRF
jgi:Flp pilus assembly protein TadD